MSTESIADFYIEINVNVASATSPKVSAIFITCFMCFNGALVEVKSGILSACPPY